MDVFENPHITYYFLFSFDLVSWLKMAHEIFVCHIVVDVYVVVVVRNLIQYQTTLLLLPPLLLLLLLVVVVVM